jgi:hypothetical protein
MEKRLFLLGSPGAIVAAVRLPVAFYHRGLGVDFDAAVSALLHGWSPDWFPAEMCMHGGGWPGFRSSTLDAGKARLQQKMHSRFSRSGP